VPRPLGRSRLSSSLLALGASLTATALAATPAQAHRGEDSVAAHCTGTAPITCHFDVAPGNYRVTALLGSKHQASSTAVWAEQRRTMLGPVQTAAGQLSRQVFTVNVRDPEGEPTGDGGVGTPGLDLHFDGAAPQLRAIDVRPARHPLVVYLAGDSTTCDQPGAPYTGWGQVLPARLRAHISVANYADSGESSGSFLNTPALFPAMQPLIKRGDYVFIQFGHNDKATTKEDYQANLRQLVTGVRAQHGRAVLVTPPVRRLFGSDGKLTPTALHVNGLGVDLPAAMKEVAAEEGVPLIDLTARGRDLLESLGPAGSLPLYLPEFRDNTHFSDQGANAMTDLVLAGARDLHLRDLAEN
jgi:lysophospholipase L1-like esterase